MTSYELAPGIAHRVNDQVVRIVAPNGGPMTGPGTNTYLVGTDELIVIDPGPQIESHVQAIVSAGAGRITRIVCTHTHEDHSPAAARLQGLTGATVCGMRAPRTDHDSELEIGCELADGDVVKCGAVTLRAVHTPGHASNHLCYLLDPPPGMLFTGDHIMQGSTVVIWPPDGNMRAYLQSLERLLDLPLRSLAPGHGYLINDPHAEVNRLIEHRLRREAKVRRAVTNLRDRATLQALLPHAYDDVPQTLYKMAALSLQAHLDKLVEDGELLRVVGQTAQSVEYQLNTALNPTMTPPP